MKKKELIKLLKDGKCFYFTQKVEENSHFYTGEVKPP